MAYWRKKVVRTRKHHTCIYCTREIRSGEYAEYNCGTWEGDFQNYYMCMRCVQFIDDNNIELSEGFYEGEFLDVIRESDKAKCTVCGNSRYNCCSWGKNKMSCTFVCNECKNEWRVDLSLGKVRKK